MPVHLLNRIPERDPKSPFPRTRWLPRGRRLKEYVSGLGASQAGTIVPVTTFTPAVTVTAGSFNLEVLGAALVSAGEYQVNVQLLRAFRAERTR